MSWPPPDDDAGNTAPLPQKRPALGATVVRPPSEPAAEASTGPAGADQTLPRAAPPAETTGQQIGPFEVRGMLGGGTFGVVYLAYDPQLHREVAIKVPRDATLSADAKEMFIKEARATAGIHHANVCPVYVADTHEGTPYFVMRFVPSTLEKLLERLRGAMRPRTAVAVARKLALGLVAAHSQNVVHRDLKPANVLYDEASSEVLIADFGLARIINTSAEQSASGGKGTPLYMSPEQCSPQRFGLVGEPSDVYNLGVILYEMLTGKLPFSGNVWEVMRDHCETPPRLPSLVRPGLDPALDALCLKAMAKSTADRYPSARAFAAALGEYLNTAPRPLPPNHPPGTSASPPLTPSWSELPEAIELVDEVVPVPPPPAPPPPPPLKPIARPRRLTELNAEDDPYLPRERPRPRRVRAERSAPLLWIALGFAALVGGGFVVALILYQLMRR